ncbi:twin transmembrane helix small protein [Granulibacter bethesdensis]|uniref:HIG1 domain-containing protein n=2 Tax=Granulibacter bethesdensis TaxID=364410 RepID=Q0BQA9_GRABC|nr:twin transmembrane helix small protein [Granulibacter bethesdensis]ABI62993.1 Hypothetical protein GbCGDNIH1_2095 [Granulibacter bethesdensis CGDNIH1]AHJ63990.1 Hypothetical protein GbCGDNIH3_2095 [Granulibacter bethesdensis]AHJ65431.1 Hypothetical protein GbCGDNIH4_2095 [Granulibacter bethesdensis CGDNIH4]AHJ68044.1 Hypothetical protein GbCGDNIH2_2095 [Granulibacter bethesdensis]APH52864.1 Hypothetical protein GbCGDNIH5_2095 [Granulibacter bethesdensis]
MHTIALILLVISMALVVGTLVAGIGSVGSGGSPERSNKLMRYRILFQGIAILLCVLAFNVWR